MAKRRISTFERLSTGRMNRAERRENFGKYWMPAECEVSIRPGWFWHEAENSTVKTPKQLFDLYMVSVDRGASFLLNVPPDRHGSA